MKKSLYLLLALSFMLLACNEDYQLHTPTLEVGAPEIVKVGQKVEFELKGEQDILSFWSGEAGNDYAYHDRDRIGAGNSFISFTCTTSSGKAGHPNPSIVPLSWSSDFSGEYTEAAMNAATWHDITSEFDWPGDVGVTTPAGSLEASGILPADGSPVYFRFYYKVAAYDATLDEGRTQWQITDFHIISDTPAGEVVAMDMYDQRWQFIMGAGCETIPTANLPALPATAERILFRSHFKPTVDLNMWAVSGPVTRPGDINLGRDKGMGIKSFSDPQLRSFYYTWAAPGEYDVTFVGVNAGVEGRKEVVRTVKVKVVQDSGTISGPEIAEW